MMFTIINWQIPNFMLMECPDGLGTEQLLIFNYTANSCNAIPHWLSSLIYFLVAHTALVAVFKRVFGHKFRSLHVYIIGSLAQCAAQLTIIILEHGEAGFEQRFYSQRANGNIPAFAAAFWASVWLDGQNAENARLENAKSILRRKRSLTAIIQLFLSALTIVLPWAFSEPWANSALRFIFNVLYAHAFALLVIILLLHRDARRIRLLEFVGRNADIVVMAADGYLYLEMHYFAGMRFGPLTGIFIAVMLVSFGALSLAVGVISAWWGRYIPRLVSGAASRFVEFAFQKIELGEPDE